MTKSWTNTRTECYQSTPATTHCEEMTFDALCEEYFRIYAPSCLKPQTRYNYRKSVERHFLPELGALPIAAISPAVLSELFCTRLSRRAEADAPSLAGSTIKTLFHILKSILHFAILHGYISANPCQNVILPSNRQCALDKRKYMTPEELKRFLTYFAEDEVLDTIVKLLLFTGMRISELLALKRSDIDLENRTLRIRHSLSHADGGYLLTTPKSASSLRTLFLSQSAAALLSEQLQRQTALFASLEEPPCPDLVFSNVKGGYMDRCHLGVRFHRRLRGSGFEDLTLHCLRHTNATLLLNSGVDIKIVSDHLGHSNISITSNIYAKVLDESRRRTADILEERLSKLT